MDTISNTDSKNIKPKGRNKNEVLCISKDEDVPLCPVLHLLIKF